MLHRFIGIALGGLVTFVLLLLFVGGRLITDTNSAYLAAIVIGGLVAFFWPIAIAFWAARRVKARRDSEMQAEVQRQVDAQQRGS